MLARYLFSCLGSLPKPSTLALGEHSEPRRFRGTKVYLKSNRVSPDYPIDATIHHTDRGGLDVWVTWLDVNGKEYGPYQLQPGDSIEVISIRDAKALSVTPTPPAVVRSIQEAREQRPQERKSKNQLERLANFLKKNAIGHKIQGDKISTVLGNCYIDFIDGKFELVDIHRGVVGSFDDSREGVSKLAKKIVKLESKIDYEKLLEKMGDQ